MRISLAVSPQVKLPNQLHHIRVWIQTSSVNFLWRKAIGIFSKVASVNKTIRHKCLVSPPSPTRHVQEILETGKRQKINMKGRRSSLPLLDLLTDRL